MDTIFNTFKSVSLAITLGALLAACQNANGGSNNTTPQSTPAPATVGAPFANYHQTYNQINGTFVTIDKVFVRTDDGRRLRVKFKKDNNLAEAPALTPVVLNLKDLLGAAKGFVISLKELELPASVTQLDIVEIETHLKGGTHNEVTFSDQTDCKLRARRDLVFYTRQVFSVPVGADYLLKIKFDSLHSVQLACKNQKKHSHHNCHCNRDDNDDNDDALGYYLNTNNKNHKCDDGPQDNTCKLQCTLASQREEIVNLINVNDEF